MLTKNDFEFCAVHPAGWRIYGKPEILGDLLDCLAMLYPGPPGPVDDGSDLMWAASGGLLGDHCHGQHEDEIVVEAPELPEPEPMAGENSVPHRRTRRTKALPDDAPERRIVRVVSAEELRAAKAQRLVSRRRWPRSGPRGPATSRGRGSGSRHCIWTIGGRSGLSDAVTQPPPRFPSARAE